MTIVASQPERNDGKHVRRSVNVKLALGSNAMLIRLGRCPVIFTRRPARP